MEINPNGSGIIGSLGYLSEAKGQLDEAIQLTKKSLSLNPLSVQGYTNLGRYYTKLGMYGHAEAAMQQALELDPNFVNVLLEANVMHILAGEPEKARASLDRLVALAETDKGIFPFAAETAPYLKDNVLANTYLGKTLSLEGIELNSMGVPNIIGYLLCRKENRTRQEPGSTPSAPLWSKRLPKNRPIVTIYMILPSTTPSVATRQRPSAIWND